MFPVEWDDVRGVSCIRLCIRFKCICAGGTPFIAGKCLVLSLLKVVVENVSIRNGFSSGMFSGFGGNGSLGVWCGLRRVFFACGV